MSTNVEASKAGYPTRQFMDDPNIKWRSGKPNYDDVNKKYMEERTMKHAEGSLEKIVENLVKTWEMESTHKIDAKDWGSVDKEKFTINTNGGKKFNLDDNIRMGNYNMLMADSPLFPDTMSNEESHHLFRTTFKSGFAWEVLEVLSGPPNVSFTWRHWGTWEGSFGKVPPSGETLNMHGSCIARVNDQLKIESIEVFYDPNPLMAKLTKFDGTKCPF